MKLIRIGGVICAFVVLAGCEQYDWVPPATGSPYTFLQMHAICHHAARHENTGGGYVEAYGSPAFVGATVGAYTALNVIATAISTQEDFNDCMAAHGWIPVKAGSMPPPVVAASLPPPSLVAASGPANNSKMSVVQATAVCQEAIELFVKQSQVAPTAVPDDFQTCMNKKGF